MGARLSHRLLLQVLSLRATEWRRLRSPEQRAELVWQMRAALASKEGAVAAELLVNRKTSRSILNQRMFDVLFDV
jgi:hypothetical protein